MAIVFSYFLLQQKINTTDLNSAVMIMMMILTCTIMCVTLLTLSKGMEEELLGPEEDTRRVGKVFSQASDEDYMEGKVRGK